MSRKIIQITSSCCSDMNGSDLFFLDALCDDGTVWEYMPTTGSWFKFSDIPQDKEKPQEVLNGKECIVR